MKETRGGRVLVETRGRLGEHMDGEQTMWRRGGRGDMAEMRRRRSRHGKDEEQTMWRRRCCEDEMEMEYNRGR